MESVRIKNTVWGFVLDFKDNSSAYEVVQVIILRFFFLVWRRKLEGPPLGCPDICSSAR